MARESPPTPPGAPPPQPGGPPGELRTDSVIAAVYDELRALAAFHMRRERPDHTLRPTDLVHEVYLRMASQQVAWANRAQFICIAARQIRRVLVDHARAHGSLKRGGGQLRVTLSDLPGSDREFDVLELNQALDRLDEHSSQDRMIVELKYFGGLKEVEIAEVLSISLRTVRRRWSFARAWLFRELGGGRSAPP